MVIIDHTPKFLYVENTKIEGNKCAISPIKYAADGAAGEMRTSFSSNASLKLF